MKDICKFFFLDFLVYNTLRPPMSVHTNISAQSFQQLYRQHIYIYEALVLLYRYIYIPQSWLVYQYLSVL